MSYRLGNVVSVVLSPLKIFSIAQELSLLPAWPALPNPSRISHHSVYRTLLPELPTSLTLQTCIGFTTSALGSPLVLLFASHCTYSALNDFFLDYTRLLFPRPQNPDNMSELVASKTLNATVLASPPSEYTLKDRCFQDLVILKKRFTCLGSYWKWLSHVAFSGTAQLLESKAVHPAEASPVQPVPATQDEQRLGTVDEIVGHLDVVGSSNIDEDAAFGTDNVTEVADQVSRDSEHEIADTIEIGLTLNQSNQVEATLHQSPIYSLGDSVVDERKSGAGEAH
jgi:hypothetical protein